MSSKFDLKGIINKCNGQLTANFPKKKMPKELLELIKKNPLSNRILKIRLEGFG